MDATSLIIQTVEYSKKFKGRLTYEELKQRLISDRVVSDRELKPALKKLGLKLDTINDKTGIWMSDKEKKAKDLALIIGSRFKYILFIGLTGSVAAGYPQKNDDIDLFIVTREDTLWLSRLMLRFYIFIHKIPHRRYGQREEKDQFCFNFWLDESNLSLPSDKQNLKNAIDLILMKPLIDKSGFYHKFIRKNGWAERYVATGYQNIIKQLPITNDKLKTNKDNFGMNWILKITNWLVFIPQFIFMYPKIGLEKVDLHRAFFHKS